MKHNILQKALAVGIIAVTSSYASAASFTFTESAGFEIGDVDVAYYGAVKAAPAPAGVSGEMFWYDDPATPDSELRLVNPAEDTAIAADTWMTITTLFHENNTISALVPATQGWSGQDILGRLIIKDGGVTVFDNVDPITIDLKETTNANCVPANPTGSPLPCDDFFTFTSIGLAPVTFTDNLGIEWEATFRLNNFVNSALVGEDTVYTAEGVTSSLDVEMMLTQVSEVPEPATLGLFGLGLLGLGFAKRRKLNA